MLKKNWTNFRFQQVLFYLGLILVFVLCVNVGALFEGTTFLTFQHRDIIRAQDILRGGMIFYGPEMTGGGNLPGSFYYYLLAISQFFHEGWISAWLLLLGLTIAGMLILASYFRSAINSSEALLWFVLASLCTSITYYFKMFFLNVTYLIPLNLIILLMIARTFDHEKSDKQREISFLISLLLIGLGLQLHFSIFCYFIALISYNVYAWKARRYYFNRRIILKGLLFFVLPSIPYLLWFGFQKLGIQIGKAPFFSGDSAKAPLSLVHLLQFGAVEISFLSVLKGLMLTVPLPFLIAGISYFVKDEGVREHAQKNNSILLPFAFCLAISFLLVVERFYSPQASRYTLPFTLCALVMTFYFLKIVFLSPTKKRVAKGMAIGILIPLVTAVAMTTRESFLRSLVTLSLSSLLFIILSYVLEGRNFFKSWDKFKLSILLVIVAQAQLMLLNNGAFALKEWGLNSLPYAKWKNVWTIIHAETNWSFSEARERLFFIGHHMEQDPELVLATFKNENIEKKSALSNRPDGFIISTRFPIDVYRSLKDSPAFIREWLRQQNFQIDLKNAIENKTVRLGNNLSNQLLLIPYWVDDKQSFPPHFHNLGEGYKESKDDRRLLTVKSNEGVELVAQDEFIFKWNECPEHDHYCDAGAILRLNMVGEKKADVFVRIIGSSLSQVSPWISPNWTQAWIDPYLYIKCSNENPVRHSIASSIGFLRQNSHGVTSPLLQSNNSFIAPFNRIFSVSCKERIEQVGIGRRGALVEKITTIEHLPAKLLTIER